MPSPLDQAREYAAAWMQARESASPLLRETIWTRSGLCHTVFDMLDILTPEHLRALFEEDTMGGES